jgi:hypothetical protein
MLLISCLLAAAVAVPQSLPSQQPPPSASSSTVPQREKALNAVFSDYWEQQLKNSPESPPPWATSAMTTN